MESESICWTIYDLGYAYVVRRFVLIDDTPVCDFELPDDDLDSLRAKLAVRNLHIINIVLATDKTNAIETWMEPA
jgi:hypothetical protein